MKTLSVGIVLSLLLCTHAVAQDTVMYSSTDAGGKAVEVTAVLSVPKTPGSAGQKAAAVILLHSNAGWEHPVTGQYAKALSEAGFLVLEPRLFSSGAEPASPLTLLPMVYDALRYLSTRADVDAKRIGVAGFSYGGMLALHSAASWAQVAYARSPDLKFAAHAPFYPLCWIFSELAQGKRKPPKIPGDAFTKWTMAPVKIFAGGKDDYDDNDPNACSEFISHIPAAYQASFTVQLYPEATHGWDQQTAKFYEKFACKGRGCTNYNQGNLKITEQGIKDLLAYFGKALAVSP